MSASGDVMTDELDDDNAVTGYYYYVDEGNG